MATKKTLYFFYPNDGACNFHRVLQPARFCHDKYDKDWHFEVGPGPAHGKEVYYFSGLPNVQQSQATLLEIQYLRRKGATFVWSLDDDWLSIPEWNPAKPNEVALSAYDMMKGIADWIVVSTPYLAETLKDVAHKVLVAPNLLDLSMFPEVHSEIFEDANGRKGKRYDIEVKLPVRVVWVGSETHRGDVDIITEPLDEFLGKYCGVGVNQLATVLFNGMMPHGDLVRKYLHKGLFYQPMVPFSSYHSIVSSLQPHVYLAPLADIPFNRGKSNLRVIEGWAMNAPSIATNVGEYATTINHTIDGCIANTPTEFYNHLVGVVTNHEYRVALASYGRMKLETQYNWQNEQCRKSWYNVFDKILGY